VVTVTAGAAPHVGVLATPGLTAAELEVTRAELRATGLEVDLVTLPPPEGAFREIAETRRDLEGALTDARAEFVATHYDNCAKLTARADERGRAWAGEPQVARLLAELALVAALCGDANGVTRAAAHFAALELDPRRWSPDVRERYARAVHALAALKLRPLSIALDPPDAELYIDGARTSASPAAAPGAHALYATRTGYSPVAANIDGPIALRLERLTDGERVAAVRARLADGELPSIEELAFAAHRLGFDGLVALDGRAQVRAVVAGRDLDGAVVEATGSRLAALREVAAKVGLRVRESCALVHSPPERIRAGQSLALVARGPRCLARIRGGFRTFADWRDHTAAFSDGIATIVLAADELPSSERPYVLQYYLRGESAIGSLIDGAGSPASPVRVLVDADRAPRPAARWYRKWWIWTLAGGAVAAASIATAVVLTRPSSEARLVGH
jgi:hypothetical protein